ncbi:MAG: glycosyltransferase family 4 protein [Desulfobacterales bacterium]
MKLLILANNLLRAGFRLRIAQHLDYLNREGIRCKVCQMPRKLLDRWKLFKTSVDYDAVLIHKKCLNAGDMAIFSHYCPRTIFDYDDAIMYSPSRPDSNLTSHFRLFRRMARRMDVMIAGNEYLADHARSYCNNVHILPTGLDTTAYLAPHVPKNSGRIRLVWIGSESTLKYLAQLRPVFEKIGKKYTNVVLRIIADQFFDLDHMIVQKRPWKLENEVADLTSCDIGLSPIPDNRFTRGKCGFKILQYFAAGIPVIASPVGVNEKLLREGNAGLLASDMTQWADAIEKMIREIHFYRQLGKNGQKYVQIYDRSAVSEELCRIIKFFVSQEKIRN